MPRKVRRAAALIKGGTWIPEVLGNEDDPEPVTFHHPAITDDVKRDIDNAVIIGGAVGASFTASLHAAARVITKVDNYELDLVDKAGKVVETVVIKDGETLAKYGEDAFLNAWYEYVHSVTEVSTTQRKKSRRSSSSGSRKGSKKSPAKRAKKKAGKKSGGVSRAR